MILDARCSILNTRFWRLAAGGLLLAAILLISGTAGATKYPLTVKDCRGKNVTIPREPKRIVSLTPSNTEILFALGLESKIVGVSSYCDYPAAAKKKTKVGDQTPSIEKIISLKPDLVIVHGSMNDQAIPALESHRIRIFVVDPKTIDQVTDSIKLIGKITNREKDAKRVADKISSAKALVKRKIAGIKSKPKVLIAIQADPLWTAGPKTFIDEMIRLTGGTNLAADSKAGFNQFSTEAAVWRNPDIIIGTTKGDKQVFNKGIWKGTKAAKAQKVYEANPDLLVRPGPRLADGILAIARWIQPNVFGKP